MLFCYPVERYHDVGGRIDSALDLTSVDYEPWEKDIDAIHFMLADAKRRRVLLEEFRRALTLQLGRDRYLRLDFYERWAIAIEILLVEKGVISPIDVGGSGFDLNVLYHQRAISSLRDGEPENQRAIDRQEAQRRVALLKQALIDRGIVTQEEIDQFIAAVDAKKGGRDGARVVARAWADPAFKKALLKDANPAIRSLGIDLGFMHICVVENTPEVHNLIVCTLCSCYPRYLLGRPPVWYKSLAYRSRAVREPKEILQQLGVSVPDGVRIQVHDSCADLRYLVLPVPPPNVSELSEAELIELVTCDGMIGAALR
jgi:nitrile hydratase subunit alpha